MERERGKETKVKGKRMGRGRGRGRGRGNETVPRPHRLEEGPPGEAGGHAGKLI